MSVAPPGVMLVVSPTTPGAPGRGRPPGAGPAIWWTTTWGGLWAATGHPTRLAWAKEQAQREIDAASDADFGMVIAFNSTAEIRQSYTNNRAELKAAVAGVEPTQ